MSDEKLIVTKSKLDALATSISNKSGVSVPMTIAQMKTAVDNIGIVTQDENGYIILPTEGGGTNRFTLEDIWNRTFDGDFITNISGERKAINSFASSNITSVYAPNITDLGDNAISNCSKLVSVFAPKSNGSTGVASNSKALKTVVIGLDIWANAFNGCSALETVDIVNTRNGGIVRTSSFNNCTNLNKMILRSSSIVSLANINNFNGTPFASGGSGGTIYIPKVLYDQLGTGTNDYQSATNWSSIYGYGTITWACIEGSQYETHYADGTLINS